MTADLLIMDADRQILGGLPITLKGTNGKMKVDRPPRIPILVAGHVTRCAVYLHDCDQTIEIPLPFSDKMKCGDTVTLAFDDLTVITMRHNG